MSTERISNKRRAIVTGALTPLLGPLGWGSAQAAGASIPLADFFKAATISNMRMAPGGKSIAAIREVNGRSNIVVMDVATRKVLIITTFTDADVTALGWITADRLNFSFYDRTQGSGNQTSSGLFVIERDGTGFRPIAGHSSSMGANRLLLSVGSSLLQRVRENGKATEDVLILVPSMQAQAKFSSNVYRLNTSTLRSSLLTLGGPTNAVDWTFDTQHVARVALSQRDGVTLFNYRDSEQSAWRVLFEVKPEDVIQMVVPLGFDAQGVLYVSAYAGRDNAAIYRFDPAAGKISGEPVIAVSGFDLTGGLIFSADYKQLLGVRYEADRERTFWIDPERKKIQEQVDQAIPDTVNVLQFDSENSDAPVLVTSYSDRDPGRFLLFDAKKVQLLQLAASRPWIKPEAMSSTRFIRYDARDGLSIPAQLTLPVGATGKVPLVVLHYGGPYVRPIHWSWDPVVQLLASRGYAVFMPAPRASTGFGAKLFTSGWKQWGLGMQDDVTDGVRALIKDGVVDAQRVCIAGASYGGYLTMMGLVKEPDLFKCGINWVGVTDQALLFTVTWSDFSRLDSDRYALPLLIGDPVKDRERFNRTSPLERAAEIKQPVLMGYGGLDKRVPLIHGEKMRAALVPHNKQVEWVVYPDEGHGWLKLESNLDFWGRAEKFLAKNL